MLGCDCVSAGWRLATLFSQSSACWVVIVFQQVEDWQHFFVSLVHPGLWRCFRYPPNSDMDYMMVTVHHFLHACRSCTHWGPSFVIISLFWRAFVELLSFLTNICGVAIFSEGLFVELVFSEGFLWSLHTAACGGHSTMQWSCWIVRN